MPEFWVKRNSQSHLKHAAINVRSVYCSEADDAFGWIIHAVNVTDGAHLSSFAAAHLMGHQAEAQIAATLREGRFAIKAE